MDTDNRSWNENMDHIKTTIVTGFLKSTIGTGLISLGIVLEVQSYTQPGYYYYTPYVGIILILLGIIVYFFGDIYKVRKEKESVEIVQSETEELVNREAERIAKIVVDRAEAEKLAMINRKFSQVEQGICGDLIFMTDDGRELPYCSSKLNTEDLVSIQYPDDFPAEEIVRIGIKKINKLKLTRNKIESYLIKLLSMGFISETKCVESFRIVEGMYKEGGEYDDQP